MWSCGDRGTLRFGNSRSSQGSPANCGGWAGPVCELETTVFLAFRSNETVWKCLLLKRAQKIRVNNKERIVYWRWSINCLKAITRRDFVWKSVSKDSRWWFGTCVLQARSCEQWFTALLHETKLQLCLQIIATLKKLVYLSPIFALLRIDGHGTQTPRSTTTDEFEILASATNVKKMTTIKILTFFAQFEMRSPWGSEWKKGVKNTNLQLSDECPTTGEICRARRPGVYCCVAGARCRVAVVFVTAVIADTADSRVGSRGDTGGSIDCSWVGDRDEPVGRRAYLVPRFQGPSLQMEEPPHRGVFPEEARAEGTQPSDAHPGFLIRWTRRCGRPHLECWVCKCQSFSPLRSCVFFSSRLGTLCVPRCSLLPSSWHP